MDDIISKKILVTGVSGFIGSNLLRTLMHKKNTLGYPYKIRCITRNKKSMDSLKVSDKDIEILEGDLSNYDDCLKALEGVDVAYFLVHSMEGSTKKWKEFSEKRKDCCGKLYACNHPMQR